MSVKHTPRCSWRYCPGWTIDWLGFVRPCGQCARFGPDEDDGAARAAREFIASFEVLPGEGAPEPCSPDCRGWLIMARDGSEMPGFDIERCDDCGLFADDDEALTAAVKWLLEHLTQPEKYPKKRKDVGIAFDEMVGRTIQRLEQGTTEGAYGDEPTVTLHFTDGTCHTLVLAADFAPGYDASVNVAAGGVASSPGGAIGEAETQGAG